MTKYELMYIISASLSEADVQKEKAKIANFFGSVKESEGWGLRTLAYPIQKQKQGIYVVVTMSTSHKQIGDFLEYVKFNNNVLRYLLINLDNEKVRKISKWKQMKSKRRAIARERMNSGERPQRPYVAKRKEIDV